MMGQRVRDLILGAGDWGAGSALNLVLLVLSVVFSLVAYWLGRLNRIQT
jgi:ABC-type spermidine/putrescine transport system permease subunit I